MKEWLRDGSLFYREERTIIQDGDKVHLNGEFTVEELRYIVEVMAGIENQADTAKEYKCPNCFQKG